MFNGWKITNILDVGLCELDTADGPYNYGLPYVVCYDSWEISEEGGPKETEEGWCLAGQDMHPMDQDEPEKWARIIHPNRHMPASWDGPGDQR